MQNRETPYTIQCMECERVAVAERDLHHLDQRIVQLTSTVDVAHTRLATLYKRIERLEWQLDATATALKDLSVHTSEMSGKLPEVEQTARILRWILDSAKYLLAAAILAGTFASNQALSFVRALFGG